MTFRVILMPRAERDRDRIYSHTVKHWGKQQAQQWYEGLAAVFAGLESLPERHPIAPESDNPARIIRHIIHPPFRVLFVIEGKRVNVLHIRHAARLPIQNHLP